MRTFTSSLEHVNLAAIEKSTVHTSVSGPRRSRWLGRAVVALILGPFVAGIANSVINSPGDTTTKC